MLPSGFKEFFKINRRFLPIKLHYGLFNAGTSTVQPTMPLYAKVLGFSSFVVGTIYTILPLCALLLKPMFGGLADKFKIHRSVLIGWVVVVLASYLAVWFIPPAVPDDYSSSNKTILSFTVCSSAGSPSYLKAGSKKCSWKCDLTPQRCENWNLNEFCDSYPTEIDFLSWKQHEEKCISIARLNLTPQDLNKEIGCSSKCSREFEDKETFRQWQFWLFTVLLILSWGGTFVITAISDTICIEICEDPHLYGKQRMWGSLAWGVFCIINGFAVDAFSKEGVDSEDKNYDPSFILMIIPLLLDILISLRLKITIPDQAPNIAKEIWKVFLIPRNFIFAVKCGLVGMSFGILWNFEFWLIEDLAKAQGPDMNSNVKTIEGLVSGFQTFGGEGPAFFYGGWLVKKIGQGHSMTLVFLAIGIRFVIYSFLVNPWWFIPVEVLQNNYGIFYSVMTSYAKEYGPPGTEATMQSILSAICEGIGLAIGSFLGGLFYDNYGGGIAFRIFGISFVVLAFSNEIVEFILKTIDKRSTRLDNNQIEGQINSVVNSSSPDNIS